MPSAALSETTLQKIGAVMMGVQFTDDALDQSLSDISPVLGQFLCYAPAEGIDVEMTRSCLAHAISLSVAISNAQLVYSDLPALMRCVGFFGTDPQPYYDDMKAIALDQSLSFFIDQCVTAGQFDANAAPVVVNDLLRHSHELTIRRDAVRSILIDEGLALDYFESVQKKELAAQH